METLKEVLKICQLGDCTGCEMHDYAHCRDLVMRDSLNVIEALEAELSRYTENCKHMVEQAKAEVAREIFEELEREIELALECNYKIKRDAQSDNEGLVIYVDGKIDCLQGLTYFIAELKKKYTESCTTCKHMVSCEPNVFGVCDEYAEDVT